MEKLNIRSVKVYHLYDRGIAVVFGYSWGKSHEYKFPEVSSRLVRRLHWLGTIVIRFVMQGKGHVFPINWMDPEDIRFGWVYYSLNSPLEDICESCELDTSK